MKRVFVLPEKIQGSTITIDDPGQLHHLRNVLRLGAGEPLLCCDGEGVEYRGTIIQSRPERIILHVERRARTPQATLSVWVAQGLPKGNRFDWVVEKATELGVSRLSPLLTRHTVVRLSPEQGRVKRQRWERIAAEAAKQCGRATIPLIDPPQSLEALFPLLAGASLVVMPTLVVSAVPLGSVLNSAVGRVTQVVALIGPEGDFSPEEVAAAQRHGARPVSLGPLTLRSETAAVALAAILRHVLDECA